MNTMSNYDRANAMRKTLPSRATALATELGDGWNRLPQGDLDDWRAVVSGPDGERIALTVDTAKPERIVISGDMPPEVADSGAYTSDLGRGSITVAADRGEVVMAREVRRRLLPEYAESLATGRERAKHARQVREQRDVTARRIADLLGIPAPAPGRYAGRDEDLRISLPSLNYGHINIRTGGHVQIEVSGDLEKLRDVIAAIGKANA